jgi:hypothetical protein
MKEFYSAIQKARMEGRSIAVGSSNVRYGKEDNAKKLFDEIVAEKSPQVKEKKINELIDLLEKNSEQNSFFSKNEEIEINVGAGASMGPKIKLDDINIYKMFFDTYCKFKNEHPEVRDGVLHKKTIEATIKAYFGNFNGNMKLRQGLTMPEIDWDKFEDANYKPEIPSISKLKNKNCAMCVERASVAHNLWLLGGYESYYIDASSIQLADALDEGHAYCIVNYNGTFKLFDCSMNLYHAFDKGLNPIEEILNGKPLILEINEKRYIYANNYALEKEQELV